MESKEEILKQALKCHEYFSKHLTALKNIPPQNFSSEDQANMYHLQNGIDALKSLTQKITAFSEGDKTPDTSIENVAIEKASEVADSLEGQTGKSQVGEPGDVDKLLENMYKASELTEINDFKPKAGAPKEDINDWTPETNRIDNIMEAFSNYVANDYYSKTTGRNFSPKLHIGSKSISLSPKDWLKVGAKKTKGIREAQLDPVLNNTLQTGLKGASIGAVIDIAASALARNLNYEDYVELCKLKGVEPLEKSKYTIGTIEDLKKSILRGGSLGAVSSIAIKGGKGAMEGFKNNMINYSDVLTEEDFVDANAMAKEITFNTLKQNYSFIAGYYPSNTDFSFKKWMEDNSDEVFSLLADNYNKILEETVTFANASVQDIAKGASIGGALGALSATAMKAIKANKSYDAYAAEAAAKGEKPVSRARYIAQSKDLLKSAGKGALVGGALGAGATVMKGDSNFLDVLKSKGKITGKSGGSDKSSRMNDDEKKGFHKVNEQLEMRRKQIIAGYNNGTMTYKQMEQALSKLEAEKNRHESSYGATLNGEYTRADVLKALKEGKSINNLIRRNFDPAIRQSLIKDRDAIAKMKNILKGLENMQQRRSSTGGYDRNTASMYKGEAKNKLTQKQINEFNKQLNGLGVNVTEDLSRDGLVHLLKNSISDRESQMESTVKKLPAKVLKFFSETYGYIPQTSNDPLFKEFCFSLVREGYLDYRDLYNLNFNCPLDQKDFANMKATLATSAISAGVSGLGGAFLANKKIKEEERKLGRPLTPQEKSSIRRKYIGGAAAAGAIAGGAAAHGVQSQAAKGNKNAQGIVNYLQRNKNDVSNIIRSKDSLWNKGENLVSHAQGEANRLKRRFIKGESFEEQDVENKIKQQFVQRQNAARKKMEEQGIDSLTDQELSYLKDQNERSLAAEGAKYAGRIGLAMMGYKHLMPLVKEAMSSGSDITEQEIAEYANRLKQMGKSDQEIQEAVRRYIQAKQQRFY